MCPSTLFNGNYYTSKTSFYRVNPLHQRRFTFTNKKIPIQMMHWGIYGIYKHGLGTI